eukprot:TRINITY_DN72328_c0_g1_i1.p1 TRINITY_DN72328_c0_g1~~TRINITY_DN72328_c0_g1_i1.p1  ORF type:complete len:870 (+),score=215.82 TRINITY_DN72328_c0_g1_i1:135-2744(+)
MGDEGGDDRQANLLEEDREAIRTLQSEQVRKLENLDRLKQKAKALQDELSARRGELAELDAELQSEARVAGKAKESAGRTKTEEVINAFMKLEVRKLLQERVPIMADTVLDSDDRAAALQDRQEQAGEEAAAGQDKVHDTVLVSYVNYQLDGKPEDYKVSIRIDRDTTVEQLHRDACAYWGCSTHDFVLCKLDSNAVVSLDTKMGERLQSDQVLNPAEEAHLHLVRREYMETFHLDSKRRSAEADRKAAGSQASKDADADADEAMKFKTLRHGNGVAVSEQQEEAFVEALKPWPGVYSLLRNRRRKTDRLRNKIKFRDLVIFAVLVLLSALCIAARNTTSFYHVLEGVRDALVVGRPAETSDFLGRVTNFDDVQSWEDVWSWLGGSFHYQVYNNRSLLRQYFVPVGHVRLRQQIAPTLEQCPNTFLPEYVVTQPCSAATVSPTQQQKASMVFKDFINMSEDFAGRMPTPDPRVWQPATNSGETYGGYVQTYDGSGYMLVYSTSLTNVSGVNVSAIEASSANFADDLFHLQTLWVNSRTRMFAVELTLANYHMNGYVALEFVVEITPSGGFIPSYRMLPLRLFATTYDEIADALDILRAIIIFGYVASLRVFFECKRKCAKGKRGIDYVLSLFGLTDMALIGVTIALLVTRNQITKTPPSDRTAFHAYTLDASIFHNLVMLEAAAFCITLLRWTSFLRIFSRKISTFWKILGKSLKYFVPFLAMFIPLLLGFIFLVNAVYSPHLLEFSDWYGSTLQVLLALRNQLLSNRLFEKEPAWTIVIVLYFFLAVTAFFGNMFLAITVHSFFEVELLEGANEEQWDRDQWLEWMLWAPLFKIATGKEPGAAEADALGAADPTGEEGEEGDEDEEKG